MCICRGKNRTANILQRSWRKRVRITHSDSKEKHLVSLMELTISMIYCFNFGYASYFFFMHWMCRSRGRISTAINYYAANENFHASFLNASIKLYTSNTKNYSTIFINDSLIYFFFLSFFINIIKIFNKSIDDYKVEMSGHCYGRLITFALNVNSKQKREK